MTTMKLTNFLDLELAKAGRLPLEEVRTLELEALVDTGAVDLVLPEDVVRKLGLPELTRRAVRLADGTRREFSVVSGLRLEVLGRPIGSDAYVVPAGAKALLGQLQLEALDLIVDPRSRELRINPDGPPLAGGYLHQVP